MTEQPMTDTPGRVRQWLVEAALPFWSGAGLDREAGGFVERLHLDGTPDLSAPKRLRVQARQIYVFSHAHVLGLMPGGDAVAAHGYDFVVAHGCPDGIAAGFVHALARDGTVVDARRDSYDHAFLLLAFSWFHLATGRADARVAVLALGDAIEAVLRHPRGHGYVVDDRGGDALHQNPHMHLFEAMLAAYDATGEEVFLRRARVLFGLFRERMFDAGAGVLREFHDADWQPAPGEAGQVVEPGHHCEWAWLLKCYADRVGEPLADEAYRLHDFAMRHGRPGEGVLLCDELSPDGRVRKPGTRCWPQTEAIKALVALAEARGEAPGPELDAIVEALFETFLDRPMPGAWIDWVDAAGTPIVGAIPASTLYHLFLGLSEYLRARDG
jgi:mannose/cellobiose epimerase-like protein (N-acyl-D-glucosamine 2-epimerase family)